MRNFLRDMILSNSWVELGGIPHVMKYICYFTVCSYFLHQQHIPFIYTSRNCITNCTHETLSFTVILYKSLPYFKNILRSLKIGVKLDNWKYTQPIEFRCFFFPHNEDKYVNYHTSALTYPLLKRCFISGNILLI